MAARIVQVRLRFVIVLGAAFLVIGQWNVVRDAFDRLADFLVGATPANQGITGDTEFFCPMDPGIVSNWPTICPICNMDLVRRKKGTAALLPAGVVARMQLSPYRIQLAGIRTSPVTFRPLVREIRLAGILQNAPQLKNKPAPMDSASQTSEPHPEFILNADVSERDLRFLNVGRTAELALAAFPEGPTFIGEIEDQTAANSNAESPSVSLHITDRQGLLRAGMFARAVVRTPLAEIEPYRSSAPRAAAGELLAVPEIAVIDTGLKQVVYVETMPGMFDGVEVVLGPRCGDDYPVLRGLEEGWNVATTGAFLIDAETRLNPNLAAEYFGASHGKAASPAKGSEGPVSNPSLPAAKPAATAQPATTAALSPVDAALAAKQRNCPVTGLSLNSMGGPYAVVVANRKVFLCCKGCEAKFLKEPERYLKKTP